MATVAWQPPRGFFAWGGLAGGSWARVIRFNEWDDPLALSLTCADAGGAHTTLLGVQRLLPQGLKRATHLLSLSLSLSLCPPSAAATTTTTTLTPRTLSGYLNPTERETHTHTKISRCCCCSFTAAAAAAGGSSSHLNFKIIAPPALTPNFNIYSGNYS